MPDPKPFCVFYSWQATLPDDINRPLIRQALRNAATATETAKPEWVVTVDEATRNTPGSPNIPLTILGKIDAADMFVCDVTTVNRTSDPNNPLPNPNVVFELGYAVATLGWDRVVLLFNKARGTFPDDLPFDFDRHRASPFTATETNRVPAIQSLSELLETCIDAVLVANPPRPGARTALTPEARKRIHDVAKLTAALSTLHLPTIDAHIRELPRKLSDRSLYFWEWFHGVVGGTLFHLYDGELADAFAAFHAAFLKTIVHDEWYHPTRSGTSYIFSNPGDLPFRNDQQRIWDEIDAARQGMRAALDRIVARVRSDYLEIDLAATSQRAWTEYVAAEREDAEMLREE